MVLNSLALVRQRGFDKTSQAFFWQTRRLERLREPRFQELSQFCRGLELRNRLQFFECRGERVGETPDRPGAEFLVLGLEIEVMHAAGEVLWGFQFALDERLIDG